MDKMCLFKYIALVAFWDFLITGISAAALNIVYACFKHPFLSSVDLMIMYITGFIVLFFLNISITDEI